MVWYKSVKLKILSFFLLAYVIELTGRSPSSQVRGKRTPRKSPNKRQKGSWKSNSSVGGKGRPDVAKPSITDDSDSGVDQIITFLFCKSLLPLQFDIFIVRAFLNFYVFPKVKCAVWSTILP